MKNSEGAITPKEKAKLEEVVADAEQLMDANTERLAGFAQIDGGPALAGAVPVTVAFRANTNEREVFRRAGWLDLDRKDR